LSIALLAVGFAASLGFADSASAAKKLTYDQAGGLQGQDGQIGVPGTGLQANERYIRGSNCMKRYGYRI
jgi:hypothetical protein